jgi:hypothetical protein
MTISRRPVAPFGSIEATHRTIREGMEALASDAGSTPGGVAALAEAVRSHLDVLERFVFPELDRVEPDEAADIANYPRRHEERALRILDSLAAGRSAPDTQVIRAAAVELEHALCEIEDRVVPQLLRIDDATTARLEDTMLSELG